MSAPGDQYVPASYWESLLAAHFDESGVAYPEVSASFNKAIYAAQVGVVTQALDELGVHPRAVLDVGPGIGIWIRFWEARGAARIVGVDLTSAAVTRLQQQFPSHELRKEDISSEGALDIEPVDAASAMSVLLHIVDEAAFHRALGNLARAVSPGGWLVLLEPAVVHRWWGPEFGPASNSRARGVTEWRSALDAAGFELVEVRPVTALLANPCDTRTRVGWRVASAYWRAIRKVVGRRERFGAAVGRVLLAIDRLCRRVVRTGPSTKLLVARRRP